MRFEVCVPLLFAALWPIGRNGVTAQGGDAPGKPLQVKQGVEYVCQLSSAVKAMTLDIRKRQSEALGARRPVDDGALQGSAGWRNFSSALVSLLDRRDRRGKNDSDWKEKRRERLCAQALVVLGRREWEREVERAADSFVEKAVGIALRIDDFVRTWLNYRGESRNGKTRSYCFAWNNGHLDEDVNAFSKADGLCGCTGRVAVGETRLEDLKSAFGEAEQCGGEGSAGDTPRKRFLDARERNQEASKKGFVDSYPHDSDCVLTRRSRQEMLGVAGGGEVLWGGFWGVRSDPAVRWLGGNCSRTPEHKVGEECSYGTLERLLEMYDEAIEAMETTECVQLTRVDVNISLATTAEGQRRNKTFAERILDTASKFCVSGGPKSAGQNSASR
ncbi:hypothetical protein ERJ75_000215100 [Trypanosoma vivax]|nr:hypothetical protein TRVL_08342 [Trypanosoma vivax]KAH8619168.1 hypothetical protein ERJ75_000215100 [Trypanosoma vivax]